jgi:hypothetical protein
MIPPLQIGIGTTLHEKRISRPPIDVNITKMAAKEAVPARVDPGIEDIHLISKKILPTDA